MNPAEKAATVAEVDRRLAAGEGLRRACRRAKTSPASYGRWKERLEEAGGDPEIAFAPRKPTGRPRGSGVRELTPDEARACAFVQAEEAIAQAHAALRQAAKAIRSIRNL